MKDFIIYLLQLVISLASYVFLGPIIILVFLVNEVVRLIVSLNLEHKYNGNVKLVTDGADALWALKREGKTRMVIVGMKMNKAVSLEQVTNCLKDNVLKAQNGYGEEVYSKLKMILVQKFSYACWKRDANFDLKNHVRSLSPRKVYTKKELSKEVSLMSQDMSEDRPQWELISVPRFAEDGEPETALILFRFLHAYMDGFSLLMMFKNHMSSGFDYYLNPQEFNIPFWKKMLFYTNSFLVGPYYILLFLANKFRSFWPKIEKGPPKSLKNFTWTKSMDLGAIRNLRKSLYYATIPTILENAFITAAGEVLPKDRIPDVWGMGELAALLPYPTIDPQNRFAIVMYDISTLQPEFERIKTSKEDAWKAITAPWIPLSFGLFKAVGRLPVVAASPFYAGGSCSLIFSNMPLSKSKFTFLDTADVLEVIGFPPLPNDAGIFLCSAAYENTLKISASSDSTWLKGEELEKIVERIPKVLDRWAMKFGLNKEGQAVHNNN